jgi:DNA polymerase
MLTNRQLHCLKGIGIRHWPRSRAVVETTREPLASEPVAADLAPAKGAKPLKPEAKEDRPLKSGEDESIAGSETGLPPKLSLETWDEINQSIQQCTACELARNCSQKVPGSGNRQADLMIIGEGPGHDEDIQGEPFVGRSGQLLDKMLSAIGLDRDQVFITNIVKCRPPNNRDPKQQEAQQCRVFLDAQIRQIKPRVILSVGRVSAQSLLETKQPVGKLLEHLHQLPGAEIPLKVTYHPAYLLRTPSAKAIVWQDLKRLHQILNR